MDDSAGIREWFPRRTRYCVAIPVLNEGDRLRGQLVAMKERAELADIVIADGGSSDGSTDPGFLQSCGVRALLPVAEPGLSAATRVALAYALRQGYEGIVTVDGNGKDGVDALPLFLRRLDEGFDLVQGSRFIRGGVHRNTPWERLVGIRLVIAPLLAAAGGVWLSDPTNGFRALSRRLLEDPRIQPLRPVFVRFNLQHYLVHRAAALGFRVTEVPVRRVYPAEGPVPTKIVGWEAKFAVFRELLDVIAGRLNPR